MTTSSLPKALLRRLKSHALNLSSTTEDEDLDLVQPTEPPAADSGINDSIAATLVRGGMLSTLSQNERSEIVRDALDHDAETRRQESDGAELGSSIDNKQEHCFSECAREAFLV